MVFAEAAWTAWAWRVPFLLSLGLLAISLWMRIKLSESPVFQAMKAAGELARNPLRESFTYPGNARRIFIALFGIAAGLTVIWYTAMFSGLAFLKGPMRIDDTAAEIIVGIAACLGMGFFILFGHMSDRWGRKPPIVWGYALTLLLLFPLYWLIGAAANPLQAAAARNAPVTVSASGCNFDVFAKEQATPCGKILAELGKLGVRYSIASAAADQATPTVTIGGDVRAVGSAALLRPALEAHGYGFAKHVPSAGATAVILAGLLGLMALSGATYGSVAALLAEMFPPRIRYSSMSIPYHIGTGYFGGFLPLIASYIIARTGDPYAGLWYTWGVVLIAFVVSAVMLRETHGPGAERPG